MCSQLKQAATIEEMKTTIDSLTAEVTELRSDVADLRAALQLATAEVHTSESTNAKWTEVVRRRKKVNSNGVSNGKSNPAQSQNHKFSKPEHQHSKQSTPVCCLLYTSPSPRDATLSRMPSSA